MTTNRFTFKTFASIILAGFVFTSCSSDDDSKPAPAANTDKTNSYTLNIGDQEFTNSWKQGETHEGTMLWSTYTINDAGNEIITLGLTVAETELIFDSGLHIENNKAFPLGDVSVDDWDEDLEHAFIIINIGDDDYISYSSYSGTVEITNLKRDPFFGGFGGFASYDLSINGIFRKFDPALPYLEPEDQEQVLITGNFHVAGN